MHVVCCCEECGKKKKKERERKNAKPPRLISIRSHEIYLEATFRLIWFIWLWWFLLLVYLYIYDDDYYECCELLLLLFLLLFVYNNVYLHDLTVWVGNILHLFQTPFNNPHKTSMEHFNPTHL